MPPIVADLAGRTSGRDYWRSIEELLAQDVADGGRAPHGDEAGDWLSRRDFLGLLGASIALAGLDGCTRMPAEKILPYVDQPPELTPGIPLHFATSMVLDGFATGLLVESHVGRPTKVEGNPLHPASLGAAGVFEQASVLQLYDPNRARRVRRGNALSTWAEAAAELAPARLAGRVGSGGAGLRLLLEPTSSPLTIELLQRVRTRYPGAGIHFHAPLAGEPLTSARVPQYDLSAADVVLVLDADFLGSGPFHLRYARQFADRRRLEHPADGMNRLYVVESAYSVTGSVADNRLPVAPSAVEPLLRQLLAHVSGGTVIAGGAAAGTVATAATAGIPEGWAEAVARDLAAHRGRSVVVVGERQSARVQSLALALNSALGNVGSTVWYTASPLAGAGDPGQQLGSLVDALRGGGGGGGVDTLLCLGGNPAYATPAALEFGALMRRVPQTMYLGMYENETAAASGWTIPAAHYLESWGDARAYDGTLSVVQPLVQPLYGGMTVDQLLATLLGEPAAQPYTLLRQSWQRRASAGGDFESFWRDAVQRGVVSGTAFARQGSTGIGTPPSVAATHPSADVAVTSTSSPSNAGANDAALPVELVFLADPRVYDGSFANNAWLQEFPEPLTTLTWGNVAQMSPATAQRLALSNGDAVQVEVGGRAAQLPCLIVPGHADSTVSLHLGYGRNGAESVARGVGVNCYVLWPADRPRSVSGATLRRAMGMPAHALALTQTHWTLESRDPVRVTTLAEYQHNAGAIGTRPGRMLSLYEPPTDVPTGDMREHQWGMTIDLNSCTGCGACVIACQAENNVPTVGRAGVLDRREMHWLRLDRYYNGPVEQPLSVSQPMLCQQCEKAPCEYVCPVEATVHSPDGLNEMVYNRCVGTRFCSNNCPYKVRRFNWFDYNRELNETVALVKNPDVTVRERGVMEKCTFCVQRIRESEIAAGVAGRELGGNDVQTACQQTCPSRAIVFGSITDPRADVTRLRRDPRAYSVLEELGTEPRVRYLARVRNPNPELGAAP